MPVDDVRINRTESILDSMGPSMATVSGFYAGSGGVVRIHSIAIVGVGILFSALKT